VLDSKLRNGPRGVIYGIYRAYRFLLASAHCGIVCITCRAAYVLARMRSGTGCCGVNITGRRCTTVTTLEYQTWSSLYCRLVHFSHRALQVKRHPGT
jgi:hypothetical protein